MTSVMKCMGAMTTAGFAVGAGLNYALQKKVNKNVMQQVEVIAKDGKMPDGKTTIEDAKKQLNTHAKKASLLTGIFAGVTTAIISGLTLLLRGKVIR